MLHLNLIYKAYELCLMLIQCMIKSAKGVTQASRIVSL